MVYILKRSKMSNGSFSKIISFIHSKSTTTRIVFTLIALPLLYGFALALLLSPTTIDVNAYHESRILLMQQQGTYFLKEFNDICEVVYGLGYDLVLHNHLRFGEDRGLGIYGYISLLCITGFLFNFLNDKETKEYWYFLPAVLFLGLIEPIYQSFSAKNDLSGALACLASFHFFLKWKKSPTKEKFFFSLLAITWAIACKKVYLAFALPLLILWIREWKKEKLIFSLSVRQLLFGTSILLFVSPVFTYLYNIFLWSSWTGPEDFVQHHKNQSILLGTIANFFRYSTEIFHCPKFVDVWLINNLGFSIITGLNQLWSSLFFPFFGNHGESSWPFLVQWEQFEDSWFGPLGFILFVGFITGLFLKKHSHQKYSYFFCILIILILCNQLAWRPFNDRYFSLFFILVAILHSKNSFLNSIPVLRTISLTISIILLNWAVFFNKNMHTLNFVSLNLKAVWNDISENSVWMKTNFGRSKLGYPEIPTDVINTIDKNAKISTWTEGYIPLASITRQLSDHKLVPLRFKVSDKYIINELSELPLDLELESDYLLYLGSEKLFQGNKNKLKSIWEYKNASEEIWSLSKIIKTNT